MTTRTAILFRRRWLTIRPWLQDGASGLGLIAVMWLALVHLDKLVAVVWALAEMVRP